MTIIKNIISHIFNKRIILIQNKDGAVGIYSSYKNLQKDPEVLKHVNTDMTLKNGADSLFVNLYDGDIDWTVNIYSVDLKGDNSHLNDKCLWSLNTLQHEGKKHLNINIFGAYTFNPKF